MTATFLLVRHGATADLDVRLSGRRPGVSLSAKGASEAAALARGLAGTHINRLMTSPLDRTRETAEAIGTALGLTPEVADALIEIDLGEWTGADFATLRADARWDVWNRERATACCPGGETMGQAQARIVGLMQALAQTQDGQVIALVTHSDLIRAALAHVLGLGLDGVHRFDIDPASVSRVVLGDWGGRVLAMNITYGA